MGMRLLTKYSPVVLGQQRTDQAERSRSVMVAAAVV